MFYDIKHEKINKDILEMFNDFNFMIILKY